MFISFIQCFRACCKMLNFMENKTVLRSLHDNRYILRIVLYVHATDIMEIFSLKTYDLYELSMCVVYTYSAND